MIQFKDTLFLTDKTSKTAYKIKSDICKGKYFSRACLITIAQNKNDVFDIIPVFNLRFNSSYADLLVIGIAENKNEGIKLCAKLSAKYIESKSNKSMRDFFDNYLNEYIDSDVEMEYTDSEDPYTNIWV